MQTETVCACVTIKTLAGSDIVQIEPVPATVKELKRAIEDSGYMKVPLQKLVREGGLAICQDDDALEQVAQTLFLIQDETCLWTWNQHGNPSGSQLDVDGGILTCPRLRTDFCNVLTQEPMSQGLHFFEFHMHHIGDEQWCGVTTDMKKAGPNVAIPSGADGWTYYCGRVHRSGGSLRDGLGSFQAQGRTLKEFQKLKPSGDVIGMLVDCDAGALAFDLNGALQGACEIPKNTPLWVLTHLDTERDHVELCKPSLQDAPPSNLAALQGALLDISAGAVLDRAY